LLECAFLNVCGAHSLVVVAHNGYFGARLPEMGRRAGVDVIEVTAPWNEPFPIAGIESALRHDPDALFVVHHETSTGFVNELTELADRCAQSRTVLVVDAIASAGALPINMDKIGVDVVVATSQKGIGGVPGVGVLALSAKAWQRVDELGTPRTYAGDWPRLRAAFHRTPPESLWTPPVSVMEALHTALLGLTGAPSLTASTERTAKVGQAIKGGLVSAGMRPLATGAVTMPPVTVAVPPPGVAADDLMRLLWGDLGIRVGAGQGPLAGRVVRVSHFGVSMFEALGLVSCVEVVLDRLGRAGEDYAERRHSAAIAAARESQDRPWKPEYVT
jgi:aspartate aminotransferase-like enzyme